MEGKSPLYDRNEEEVKGYRDALQLIHEQNKELKISESTLLKLHELSRGQIWDAGKYKENDSDIIERLPNGETRTRFKTVTVKNTPKNMKNLMTFWSDVLNKATIHPLILLAAFNLDFLCIHPFRDGNGRMSRLLLLLQSYHLGYNVGQYVSIEQNKERYYETLEQSSQGWHECDHNPWAYINFILFILKNAYEEFSKKLENISSRRGSKTGQIVYYLEKSTKPISISDVQSACPYVSIDLIRRALKNLRKAGKVRCLGRGPNAQWETI